MEGPTQKYSKVKLQPQNMVLAEEGNNLSGTCCKPLINKRFLLSGGSAWLGLFAVRDAIFNRRTLFIVIPRGEQDERHGMLRIVVLSEQMQSVFESLSAAAIHVAVQAPRRFAVIEAGPDATDHNFSRV